ncbi:hypothetical protein K488DRAFT_82686 [Vararia minispora EC-137]|uniref:Uncharacterized protein n=1 Tax=Vararia minispora EC-137 TaxID=1314806 RepID=A0ACB8QVW5_9AGAM|nr:hypothetical protein K488DRAFT_82686 [Vararia minispora EC-137]
MGIHPTTYVIETPVDAFVNPPRWPTELEQFSTALATAAKTCDSRLDEVDSAVRNAAPLVSFLQTLAREDGEFVGGVAQPPSVKTAYLVAIVREMILELFPDFATREYLDIALPIHPMAHKNALAQWIPKTCPSSLLLFPPRSLFQTCDPSSPMGSSPRSSKHVSNGMAPFFDNGRDPLCSSRSSSERSPHLFWSLPRDDDETDDSLEVSPDVPEAILQTSILPEPESAFHALPTLLCMADVDNIFHVMASALHQRRAFGFESRPLVGLAFHPRGLFIQVIFGWFDNQDTSRLYCVPLPRVAYVSCRPQRAQEAYGIYDLTELRSLHAFAAFLLCLRRDMLSMAPVCTARMKALSSDAHPEILHLWRSDSAFELNADDLVILRDGTDDSVMSEAHEDRLERTVRTWYEGVYMSWSLSESEAPSLPVAQKNQGIDMSSKRRGTEQGSHSSKFKDSKGYDLFIIRVCKVFICCRDSGRSSDRMPPIHEGAVLEMGGRFAGDLLSAGDVNEALGVFFLSSKQGFTDKRSSATSETGQSVRSRVSASTFTKSKPNTLHWLLDRHVTLHSWCPEDVVDKVPAQIEPARESWKRMLVEHSSAYAQHTILHIPTHYRSSVSLLRLFPPPAYGYEDLKPPTDDFPLSGAAIVRNLFNTSRLDALRLDGEFGRIRAIAWLDSPPAQASNLEWLVDIYPSILRLAVMTVSFSLDNEDAKTAGDYRIHSVKEMCWRFSWDLLTWSIVLMMSRYVTAKTKYMAERDFRLPLIDKSFHTDSPPLFFQDYGENIRESRLFTEELSFEALVAETAGIAAQDRYRQAADSREATFAKAAFADAHAWVRAASNSESHALQLMRDWWAARTMSSVKDVEDEQPKLATCDGLVFVDVPMFFDSELLSRLPDRSRLLDLFRVGTKESAMRRNLPSEVDIATGRRVSPAFPVDKLPKVLELKLGGVDRQLSYLDGIASGSFISSSHIPGLSSTSHLDDLPGPLNIEGGKFESSTPDTEGSDESSPLDLVAGIFTIEHKPKHESGANQVRLYLTAMVKFLGVIGITDFPVYGLVTEGGIGQLVYAWGHRIKGSVDLRVRIVDRHCVCFDLKTLEGALHYACTLAKIIHDEVPRLVELIKAHQEDFNERAKADPDLLIWNMEQFYGQSGVAAKTDESKDKSKIDVALKEGKGSD